MEQNAIRDEYQVPRARQHVFMYVMYVTSIYLYIICMYVKNVMYVMYVTSMYLCMLCMYANALCFYKTISPAHFLPD